MQSLDQFDDPKVGSRVNYGLKSKSSTKRRVTSLGGGYELRQRVGTQASFQTFSVEWGPLPIKDALEIKKLLDDAAGVDLISFTHPITKIKYTVVCDEGAERSDDAPGTATISAELREVQA